MEFSSHKNVLDFYRQYSSNTVPGKFKYHYNNLPRDLNELCLLIKQQLIHPTRINNYPELVGMKCEDEKIYSVKEMLEELVKRNSKGLIPERAPKERLRLSCRFHSLLLASILKTQGIPVRVRVGFASYLSPPGLNKSCDHWICEVWNIQENRWIFVDPDLCKVDFERNEFELAGDVWLKIKNTNENPDRYGVVQWWGKEYIKANVLHDFSCVLSNELIYWEGPSLAQKELCSYTVEDFELLDRLSTLLQDVDKNLNDLIKISSDNRLGNIKDYPRYR